MKAGTSLIGSLEVKKKIKGLLWKRQVKSDNVDSLKNYKLTKIDMRWERNLKLLYWKTEFII